METNKTILNYMANVDIKTYGLWLKHKSAQTDEYNYKFLASIDDFEIYDGLQLKIDTDGNISQQFIEIKGRYVNYDSYEDCAIDATKIKELQKLTAISDIPTYICAIYYNDAKICLWKIDAETEYKSEMMRCFESQIDPNKNNMIEKEMVKLLLSNANTYKIPQYIMDLVK